jgi:hypothetical protein
MTSAHPLSPASHGAIASLKHTTLPPDLDGRQGSNRAGGVRAQIAAVCDIDAIKAWLARYVDSPATLTSYRKEAERLLWWAAIELRKPLSSLTHEDLLAYQEDEKIKDRQYIAMCKEPNALAAALERAWRGVSGSAMHHRKRTSRIQARRNNWRCNAAYVAGFPSKADRLVDRHTQPRRTTEM